MNMLKSFLKTGHRRICLRKHIRSALAIVMILPLVLIPAGCASGSNSGKGEDEAFMQKYEATVEKLEHTSLKFCFPGTEPKGWPDVKAELEKRTTDTVNASLDFKWIEFGQYMSKLKTLEASGDVYDAFCLAKPDSFYPDFTAIARESKLADITALFPENASSLYSKYSKEELEFAKVDGKLYAVPSLYPVAYCTYLMVDDALHKKYNIPDITNLDQYEAYLKAVKNNNPDLVPGIIANMVNSMKLFARAFDYVILDESQNLVYKWNDPKMTIKAWEQTPEFKEASNRLGGWYSKGYLQDAASVDQSKVTSFVFYGELSPPSEEPQKMTFNTASGEIKESNPLKVFYLYPEKKVQRDNSMGSFYMNGSFVFPASSTNTARALRFIDWAQQNRDNYYLMNYGIENKDYVLAEGYPSLPTGQDFNNRSYLYWDGNWAFRNAEYNLTLPKDAFGPGINTLIDFLDKYSGYAPHGAFYPDYGGTLKDIAAKRSQALQKFEFELAQGKIKDSGQVDKYISDMKELGTDNMVAEIQKQLDEK
ncbi:MAG TPA: hypothetical protein VHT96_00685 [Clostridia bacterium]|nr:hypothetical protein [Clostridia bacterium]